MNLLLLILYYLLILLIFYKINDSKKRFIYGILIYFFGICLFKINMKNMILYFIIGILAVFTEIIFITCFDDTWNYRKPDLYEIPYWLIPLWSQCVLLISILIK